MMPGPLRIKTRVASYFALASSFMLCLFSLAIYFTFAQSVKSDTESLVHEKLQQVTANFEAVRPLNRDVDLEKSIVASERAKIGDKVSVLSSILLLFVFC